MATLTRNEKAFVKFFEKQDKRITATMKEMLLKAQGDRPTMRMLEEYQGQVREILKNLKQGGATLGGKIVNNEYRSGVAFADNELRGRGVRIQDSGNLHVRASRVLSDAVASRVADVADVIGRRVDDVFRSVTLEAVSGSVVGYESVKKAAKRLREDLTERGLTRFKDAGGKSWVLGTYAEMAAITTTAQAHNRGMWNEFTAHGEDLVIVSYHPMACPKCQPWQGVVLSLTGATPGYPTIFDAEGDGLFHPRCRHVCTLYIPEESKGKEATDWIMEKESKKEPQSMPMKLDYIPNKENKAWAEEGLQGSPSEIRTIFSQLQPPPTYREIKGTSNADVFGNGIEIGFEARRTKERYQHVFFHEMGHLVDARNRIKGESAYHLSKAKNAPISKGIEADKKLFTGKMTSVKLAKKQEILNAVAPTSKWFKDAEVSDIICCMTGGKISGYYGHSASYLRRTGYGNAEVFANLFALKAQNKTEAFEFVRTLFPQTVKAFENALPVLKGDKT